MGRYKTPGTQWTTDTYFREGTGDTQLPRKNPRNQRQSTQVFENYDSNQISGRDVIILTLEDDAGFRNVLLVIGTTRA